MSEDFSVGVPTVNGRQNSTNCGDSFKKKKKNQKKLDREARKM